MNPTHRKPHFYRPALRLFVFGMVLLGVAFWMVGNSLEFQTRRNHPGIFTALRSGTDFVEQFDYAQELKGTGLMLLLLAPVVCLVGAKLLRQRPIRLSSPKTEC